MQPIKFEFPYRLTQSPIQLPRPIIKPFNVDNFILTMLCYDIETMGKSPKHNDKINFFYIESLLQREYRT